MTKPNALMMVAVYPPIGHEPDTDGKGIVSMQPPIPDLVIFNEEIVEADNIDKKVAEICYGIELRALDGLGRYWLDEMPEQNQLVLEQLDVQKLADLTGQHLQKFPNSYTGEMEFLIACHIWFDHAQEDAGCDVLGYVNIGDIPITAEPVP